MTTDVLRGPVNPAEVFEKLRKLAVFGRSVLHLSFPQLDQVNPSFTVLSKWCDLIASILRDECHHIDNGECQTAMKLAEIFKDVADAIVDRDDSGLVDCMCILDQFLDDTRN